MSTLTETAEHEAEEAEAENEDRENADQSEEETQAPEQPAEQPDQAVTDTDAEAIFAALDKYDETHMKTFLKKVGPLHKQFMPCPLCVTRGFVQPAAAGEVTSDREAMILRQIGKDPSQSFQESAQYHRCETCDGWGEVLTGAQKEISRTAPCAPCGGKGYVMGQVILPPVAPNGAPTYPGAGEAFTPLPQGVKDAWGRPAGHVHWGIDPAQVGV